MMPGIGAIVIVILIATAFCVVVHGMIMATLRALPLATRGILISGTATSGFVAPALGAIRRIAWLWILISGFWSLAAVFWGVHGA